MARAGNTVHIACAFSLVELLAVLYRSYLRTGGDPDDSTRDYLVLSKGHGVMAQYACMYELGWIDEADIESYFADGTRLKGLSDARVPGLEVTSGSLGHGFPIGVGMALGAKRDGTDQRTYVVVGDGELNEGTMWEAALFAAHARLRNLTVIVDANGWQAMGRTDEVIELGDLEAKFAAFGFEAATVDGHDESAIDLALRDLEAREGDRPRALVAKTTKGSGVSFMADDNRWHYTRLDESTFAAAMTELSGAPA